MRSKCPWLGLVLISLSGCGGGGDGITSPVLIRVKSGADVGRTVIVQETHKESFDEKLAPGAGRKVELHFAETTLAREGDVATKFRRRFEKAVIDGRHEPLLDGVAAILELKGEEYSLTVEGAEPIAKDSSDQAKPRPMEETKRAVTQAELVQGALRNTGCRLNGIHRFLKEMFPSQPVKMGDKWPVSAGTKDFRVTGEGKLTKVYTKEGRRFGVIEWQLKVPKKFKSTVRFEGAIDGSSTEGTEHWKTSVQGLERGKP
ncbi:hypothetical protein AYO40_00225 [Planctomycetaceae bacterium SCGC AG-212-D15]|nr:hypothetical protein AYO40_00225 [Planctomycetaceae bacterium SCGC AG-212-D15]